MAASASSAATLGVHTAECTELANFGTLHLTALPRSKALKVIKENKHYIHTLCFDDVPVIQSSIASWLDAVSHGVHRELHAVNTYRLAHSIIGLIPLGQQTETPLKFIQYDKPLKHYPRENAIHDEPHIVGTYCPETVKLPWHRIETTVHAISSKKEFELHVRQIQNLLVARPDCPGIYFLTFNFHYSPAKITTEYCISWADAAGVVKSPWYVFDDYEDPFPLLSYINSLYRPPKNHLLKDPTIFWTEDTYLGPPTWNIKCQGHWYQGCTIMHAAGPSDRRTTIFEYRNGTNLYVIKDAYWDSTRRQEEGPVLKAIHAKGIIPGVVQLKGYETVIGPNRKRILTPAADDLQVARRSRSRIVLASKGTRITRAKNVKDLLMAFFDVNEGQRASPVTPVFTCSRFPVAHRAMVSKAEILHRDMSFNNIMMYPEHDDPKGKKVVKDPPTFITAVLKEGR